MIEFTRRIDRGAQEQALGLRKFTPLSTIDCAADYSRYDESVRSSCRTSAWKPTSLNARYGAALAIPSYPPWGAKGVWHSPAEPST